MYRKTRTVEQIVASANGRNIFDELPSPYRLQVYEQWKLGTAKKIIDGVIAFQERRRQSEKRALDKALRKSQLMQLLRCIACITAIASITITTTIAENIY